MPQIDLAQPGQRPGGQRLQPPAAEPGSLQGQGLYPVEDGPTGEVLGPSGTDEVIAQVEPAQPRQVHPLAEPADVGVAEPEEGQAQRGQAGEIEGAKLLHHPGGRRRLGCQLPVARPHPRDGQRAEHPALRRLEEGLQLRPAVPHPGELEAGDEAVPPPHPHPRAVRTPPRLRFARRQRPSPGLAVRGDQPPDLRAGLRVSLRPLLQADELAARVPLGVEVGRQGQPGGLIVGVVEQVSLDVRGC